jgi:D-galactose 1-dehydrogenase
VHLSAAELHFPSNRETPIAAELSFHDGGGAEIKASFDWLEAGDPTWTIDIETASGSAKLTEGGAKFLADDGTETAGEDEEYARLYQRFAELTQSGACDVDLSPMRHVSDAFTLGKRVDVAPFEL